MIDHFHRITDLEDKVDDLRWRMNSVCNFLTANFPKEIADSPTTSADFRDEIQQNTHECSLNLMLDIHAVLLIIPVSRRTLYRMMEKSQFPKPYKISRNRVVWKRSDIISWQENLVVSEWKGD